MTEEVLEAKAVGPANGAVLVAPPALDPALVGRPLARRRQRLSAMLIDLGLIGLVVAVMGKPHMLAAAAAAGVVWFGLSRWVRSTQLRSAIALVAFVLPLVFVHLVPRKPAAPATPDTDDLEDVGLTPQEAAALLGSKDPAQAQKAAGEIGRKLRERGMTPEAEEDLREALADPDLPLPANARATLLATVAPTPQAGAARPSEIDALRAEIARLKTDRERLRNERESLQKKLKEAQARHGLKDFLLATLDDLGLSLGWSGLYFIAFLVWWNGQTPGKRLMRIRVVRLDGKPIGWFCALERFQGYLSNVTSCLLGFAQVFWEHNLQGQHDKLTNTVVVRV
jgi:hypothetical protein